MGCWMGALSSICLIGCGRVVAQKATEQLIAGDAVDRTVSQIDFRLLAGKKVFLDTQYVPKSVPGVGFVTSDYIVSSVRQKLMCDGCLLEEKMEQSDFIVEMRIGALGADGHEVIYGMPQNNYLSLASSVVQTPPAAAQTLPTIPELSVAKRNDQMAAAKIALFAYNRVTREPIWQSGLSESRSMVDDRWYFGAGPFHRGSIYTGKNRAQMQAPIFGMDEEDETTKQDYFVERRFADPTQSLANNPKAANPTPTTTAVATTTPPASTAPAAVTTKPPKNQETKVASKEASAAPTPVSAAATTPSATPPSQVPAVNAAATATPAVGTPAASPPVTVPPTAATNSAAAATSPATAASTTGPVVAPQIAANPKT